MDGASKGNNGLDLCNLDLKDAAGIITKHQTVEVELQLWFSLTDTAYGILPVWRVGIKGSIIDGDMRIQTPPLALPAIWRVTPQSEFLDQFS